MLGLKPYSNPESPDIRYPDTGFIVYQGASKQRRMADQNQKINLAYQPDNGWYPNGGGEMPDISNHSGHPRSSETEGENVYEATMGEGPMPGKGSGTPSRGIAHLFNVYSDKSSISGIPFIKNTKYTPVRVIWSILLFLAVVTMGLHLYKLCESFFEYDTQTKLDINFSALAFPAVTICNSNAVRMSKLKLASDNLRLLVGLVSPDVLRDLIDEWTPSYEDDMYSEDDAFDYFFLKKRRKRSTNSSDESTNGTRQVSVQHRSGGFFGDFGWNSSSGYEETYGSSIDSLSEQEGYAESWEAESTQSKFYSIENDFTFFLSLEHYLTRFQMGHQIRDMLVSCAYSGRQCHQRNFTTSPSSVYGNCFTLEYDKFIAKQSGPRQGLELIFYLQTDEYIPTISNSKGIQVVIHEQNSLPFPDDEGFGVSGRTDTFVGLRKLEISRKDSPYGDCISTNAFEKKYGKLYTRQTCQKLCLQERIRNACNCYDGRYFTLNKMLTIPENLSLCSDSYDLECVYDVKWNFQNDVNGCDCKNPCKESQFKKSISYREWPSPSFAHVLVDTICKEDPEICQSLKNKSDIELQNEFVKLTIFFEDLNHETMKETPDYELFQFVSDVGGTVGLWIGLSVLSVFEIFHLGIAICRYVFCGNWRQNR